MDISSIFVFIGQEDNGYFVDRNGNKILGDDFHNGRVYSEGYVVVEDLGDVSILDLKGETKWKFRREHSILSPYGEINENVFSYYFLPNEVALHDGNNFSSEQLEIFKSGYVYLVDLTTGKDVKLKEYISVDEMHDGLLKVAYKKHRSEDLRDWYKDAKYGFINKHGELKIETIFDNAQSFSEGLAAVEKNNKWFFIDTEGEKVLEGNYDFAYTFQQGLAIVSQNNKYGLIDKKGVWIVSPKYGEMSFLGAGIYKVFKDRYSEAVTQKYALLSKDGNLLSDYIFDEVEYLIDNKIIMKMNGKYYLSTVNSSPIKELIIDEIVHCAQGRVTVKLNNKLGILDADGNWVVRPEYDVISKY